MRTQSLVEKPFAEATAIFLETRKPYLAAETSRNYRQYEKLLTEFFGQFHLQEIDGDMVRAFQKALMPSCGPGYINKVCSVLTQMRKRIGQPLMDYQPLRVPKESRGRALQDGERKSLETAGKYNRELEPCHLFIQIALNTGATHKELRYVQLKHIDLEGQTVYLPESAAKNQYRMREVPLNETAFAAVTRAIEIAVERGARDPEHFLFPFRVKRDEWDPSRPQTSFKKSWAKIKRMAGIKDLRIHDCRHDAASNMLSDPSVPPEAAIEVLGHVSKQMLKRYCHLNREAKRAAVNALEHRKSIPRIPEWLKKNRM